QGQAFMSKLNSFNAPIVFNNFGSLRKSGPATTTTLSLGSVIFQNDGVVELSSGVLSIEAGYTPGGTAVHRFVIRGSQPNIDFGQLAAGGAELRGNLEVILAGGFQPTLGQTFQIMGFGSRTGTFSEGSGVHIPNEIVLVP